MGKEADQLRGEGVSRDGAGLGGKTSQLNYSQYLFVVRAGMHSKPNV
jgi:hypothetical protein